MLIEKNRHERVGKPWEIWCTVIVGHGPKGTRPAGSLPVFSTDTKEEAEALLILACSTNIRGEYISRELYEAQTLENLQSFSDRLDDLYTKYIMEAQHGHKGNHKKELATA